MRKMKEVLKRLKSPVVIIQLLTIIGTIIVLLMPELSETVKIWVGAFSTIINVFAGLNNPTTKAKF